MMLTNKLGLPPYLVDWLKTDNYDYNSDPNTISATSLLRPTRIRILSARHVGKLEQDVSDLIASRLGNAIHDSIERIETPGMRKEKRISRQLTVNGVTYTISGKYDLLQENEDKSVTLRDIKTTSVWSYIFGKKDPEYRKQLSIYGWLLAEEETVNPTAYIDFIFTDWQAVRARTEKDYPSQRLAPGYAVPLLTPDETEERIIAKLEILQQYADVKDDDLPECTPEDLWAKPDKYAVYKKKNKKATKVCDTRMEADSYIAQKKIDAYVQYRPGQVVRCNYCSAMPFCNQAKRLEKSGLIELNK